MTVTAQLNRRLLELAIRGDRPRCADPIDHNRWTSDDPHDRAIAALWCNGCEVLTLCGDAAEERGREVGRLVRHRSIEHPMTAGRGDPRGTQRWKRLRKLVLAGKTHCARCGLLFIFGMPRHPRSPTVDHIIPLHLGGDPYNLANLLAVCYSCNSRGGQALSHPPRIYRRPRVVHRW